LRFISISTVGTNCGLGGPKCIGRGGPKQHQSAVKSTKTEYTHTGYIQATMG